MDAYVSGTAGVAAIINGENAELYRANGEKYTSVKANVAHQMLASNNDVVLLKNTSKSNTLKQLHIEKNKVDCLMLFLTILDSDIDYENKLPLLEHINSIFDKDIKAYEYLCNVMFTRPLPDNSIKELSSDFPFLNTKVGCLLSSLFLHQSKIEQCCDIFKSICIRRKLTSSESFYVEGILINQGFFYYFASSQATINFLHKVHFILIEKLKTLDIKNSIQFASCIRTDFSSLVIPDNVNKQSPIRVIEKETPITSNKVGYQAKIKKQNNKKVFESVQVQITAIKTKLRSGNFRSAKKMAKELVQYQVNGGGNEYAAQSLCSLSEHAKKLHLYELQLDWALSATEIAPEDYRTFGHVADAYTHLEDMINAEKYFDTCLKAFDDNRVYGLTGLARIERARGNYHTAMKHIDTAINECGRDSAPYLVKAEILRDQYKYNESYDTYHFVCEKYPEISRAVCGKAAVLADQKKFVEAEETYNFALRNYRDTQDRTVALSGLGFLLARLGRFEESHKLLDESIRDSTFEHIVPHLSKAKVLFMQGKYKETEKLLRGLLNGRKLFVDVVEQLLDFYIKSDKLDKAEKLYNTLKTKIQNSSIIQIRYSQLLTQQHNYKSAINVLDKLKASKPRYLLALTERAGILKKQGELRSAQLEYKAVLKINRFDRVANFGSQTLNFIFNEKINENLVISTFDVCSPKTIEDYQAIGELGLLKLSQGKIKESKKLLLQIHNSNFSSLQAKYNSALSFANLQLGQKNAALRVVKKSKNNIGYIQKAVIYGVQGNRALVNENMDRITKTPHPYMVRIIKMIQDKYMTAANDDIYSQKDIYNEYLKTMLIAA